MTYRFFIDNQTLSIHFPLTREDYIAIITGSGGFLSIHFPLTREDDGRSIRLRQC